MSAFPQQDSDAATAVFVLAPTVGPTIAGSAPIDARWAMDRPSRERRAPAVGGTGRSAPTRADGRGAP